MSGFPILDLILGLVFIFFILSIVTSSVVEIIMTRLKIRNRFLATWLLTIFDKKVMQPDGKVVQLGHAIMDHCLTTALSKPGEANSFMDAKSFASALVEKLSFDINDPSGKVISNLDELLVKIENATSVDGTSLLSTELRRIILLFGTEAKLSASTTKPERNSLEIFIERLEKWFDASMDRVTGKMKGQHTRPYTFWVGLSVVILLNADTVQISKYLYENKEETKQFADRATSFAKAVDSSILRNDSNSKAMAQKVMNNIDTLKKTVPKGMPLGWDKSEIKEKGYFGAATDHFVGWLATLAAIMLGAPFWFDLLNKIANIRGSGAKPASTTDKKEKTT